MRAFVALTLPEPVRRRVAEAQAQLKEAVAGVRWVRPGAHHLTLLFLGEIPAEAADRLVQVAAGPCAGVPAGTVRLGGLGAFPAHGRPRVIWIGGQEDDAGTLRRLHRCLRDAATVSGLAPEERPLAVHVTLGRAQRALPRGVVESAFLALGPLDLGWIPVNEVWLLRSTLGPGGARYDPVHRLALGAPPGVP